MIPALLVAVVVASSAPAPAEERSPVLSPTVLAHVATRPLAVVEIPVVGAAVAAVVAVVGVLETVSLPPKVVLFTAITVGVFVGAAVAGGLYFALSPDAKRARDRVAAGP